MVYLYNIEDKFIKNNNMVSARAVTGAACTTEAARCTTKV